MKNPFTAAVPQSLAILAVFALAACPAPEVEPPLVDDLEEIVAAAYRCEADPCVIEIRHEDGRLTYWPTGAEQSSPQVYVRPGRVVEWTADAPWAVEFVRHQSPLPEHAFRGGPGERRGGPATRPHGPRGATTDMQEQARQEGEQRPTVHKYFAALLVDESIVTEDPELIIGPF